MGIYFEDHGHIWILGVKIYPNVNVLYLTFVSN